MIGVSSMELFNHVARALFPLIVLAGSPPAIAGPVDPRVEDLLKKLPDRGLVPGQGTITYVDNLSPELESLSTPDRRHASGLRLLDAGNGYLDVVRDLKPRMERHDKKAPPLTGISRGLEPLGAYEELPSRINYFFRERGINLGMLTVHDIVGSGAKLRILKDSLNWKVGDAPATLALATSGGRRGLWRLAWVKDGKNFDLWLEDHDVHPDRYAARMQEITRMALEFKP